MWMVKVCGQSVCMCVWPKCVQGSSGGWSSGWVVKLVGGQVGGWSIGWVVNWVGGQVGGGQVCVCGQNVWSKSMCVWPKYVWVLNGWVVK